MVRCTIYIVPIRYFALFWGHFYVMVRNWVYVQCERNGLGAMVTYKLVSTIHAVQYIQLGVCLSKNSWRTVCYSRKFDASEVFRSSI